MQQLHVIDQETTTMRQRRASSPTYWRQRRFASRRSGWAEAGLILDPPLAGRLHGRLLYPACRDDFQACISLFSGLINEFYFVDPGFPATVFADTPSVPGHILLDDEAVSPLHRRTAWHPLRHPDIQFTTHFIAEDPKVWLRKLDSINVYFHRQEPGPVPADLLGVPWLGSPLLRLALMKLNRPGLVVTDGSGVDLETPAPFSQFVGCHELGLGAIFRAKTFTWDSGGGAQWRFDCRGYAGEGCGPTLVWEVNSSAECLPVSESATWLS